MSFMGRKVVLDDWFVVETNQGTDMIQASIITGKSRNYSKVKLSDLEMYCEGTPKSFEIARDKYGARLSADGYMDRTDWTIHDTEKEAEDYLAETYPEDDED